MKRLFILATALFALCTEADAQSLERTAAAPARTASAKNTVKLKDGQVWWGYTGTSGAEATRTGVAETCDFAIRLPRDSYGLNGKTIVGMRFYVPNSTTALKDFSVWMSATRPANVSRATIAYKPVPVEELTPGAINEILFDEPYVINADVYVGYSFTSTEASVACIGAKDPANSDDACWMRLSTYTNNSWSTMFASTLSLAINVLFDETWDAGAKVRRIGYMNAMAGEEEDVTMTIENCSPKGVTSISYTLTDEDGNVSPERQATLPTALRYMGESTISVPIPAGEAEGFHKPVLTITKVNGTANAVPETEAQVAVDQLVLTEKAAVKRVVEEEFTGMWCGWCPRGMVGMELAEKKYGDKFIGIAVHAGSGTDPLKGSNSGGYSAFVNEHITGYPSCMLNRNGVVYDPYYGLYNEKFGLQYFIDEELARPAEADVEATAEWTDDTHKRVKVQATTQFYLDDPSASYALAYVLVSDSLTNDLYSQANYFSGDTFYSYDENLLPLVNAEDPIKGLYYNHVAIASNGVQNGFAGSIKTPIRKGVPQTHNIRLALPSSKIFMSSPSNLHVVAMLINCTRGCIVNAVKANISEPAPPEEKDPYDLNNDKSVDVSDVTMLVSKVLEGNTSSEFDLNNDKAVDVSDVTVLVAKVLSSGN
ncbi:MAG: Omp28-related outer membrane protein [Alloprevotella sp.]|nr:Omp28-related outer membrane protein [Alloprevotella sp.]